MAKEEKYVAKHLIQMTTKPGKPGDRAKGIAPVRPEIKEIKPGERIMLDPEDSDTKLFLSNGAVVKADKEDEKKATPTKAPAKKAAPAKKPAASTDEGKDGDNKELV